MIAYPHTARMAAPMGGGAAAAIVGSEEALARFGNGRRPVRVVAAQAHSERYVDGHLFAGAVVGPPEMAHRASFAAYEEAGIGPEDLDLAQVHDAYAIEELLYYEEIACAARARATGSSTTATPTSAAASRSRPTAVSSVAATPAGPTGLAQIWRRPTRSAARPARGRSRAPRVGLAHIVGAGSVCFAHILVGGGGS